MFAWANPCQGLQWQSRLGLHSLGETKCPLPIIGNGDLTNAELANQRLKDSGCDAVMIGRGCLKTLDLSGITALMTLVVWSKRTFESALNSHRLFRAVRRGASPNASGQKVFGRFSAGYPDPHNFENVFQIRTKLSSWIRWRAIL